jgi:hypothetical protein
MGGVVASSGRALTVAPKAYSGDRHCELTASANLSGDRRTAPNRTIAPRGICLTRLMLTLFVVLRL